MISYFSFLYKNANSLAFRILAVISFLACEFFSFYSLKKYSFSILVIHNDIYHFFYENANSLAFCILVIISFYVSKHYFCHSNLAFSMGPLHWSRTDVRYPPDIPPDIPQKATLRFGRRKVHKWGHHTPDICTKWNVMNLMIYCQSGQELLGASDWTYRWERCSS